MRSEISRHSLPEESTCCSAFEKIRITESENATSSTSVFSTRSSKKRSSSPRMRPTSAPSPRSISAIAGTPQSDRSRCSGSMYSCDISLARLRSPCKKSAHSLEIFMPIFSLLPLYSAADIRRRPPACPPAPLLFPQSHRCKCRRLPTRCCARSA